jgi:hypothetical protein
LRGTSAKNALAYQRIAELTERLAGEMRYLEGEIRGTWAFDEIVGRSAAIRRTLSQVEDVAPTDTTVLLMGETGTGKELFARAVHRLSPRREKFGCEGSARLARILDELVTAGEADGWVPRAVSELAHRWPIVAIDVDGLPWTEVDGPEDLYYAEQVIASDIEASLLSALPLGDSHVSQPAGAR